MRSRSRTANSYYLICLFYFFIPAFSSVCRSQNVAINTTGNAAAPENLLEVRQINTAANAVAIYAINSGNNLGTGYGLYSTKTGGGTTNIGGYFNAQNGAANYAIIANAGSVGIGTITPSTLLHVAGTMQVGTVSATTGTLAFYKSLVNVGTTLQAGVATANVTYTWPTAGPGVSAYVLTTNGSGTLSWVPNSASSWAITGNAATTAGTNFLGTTDAVDLVVKTNAAERMRILSSGNVGVGMNAPASLLHVAGQIRTGIPVGGLGGASATNGSLVFYNTANDNTTGFQSGAATSSVTYRLPLSDGTNTHILTTDGAGNLSWAAHGVGVGPTGPAGPPGHTIVSNSYVNTGAGSFVFVPGSGTVVLAELWGGGGGGGGGSSGGSQANAGGGGGGGCYGKYIFTAIAGTYTAYIGAAGTAGATNSTGGTGGNSKIVAPGGATIVEVGGGLGGTSDNTSFYGSAGGIGGTKGPTPATGWITCDGGEGGCGGSAAGGSGGLRGGGQQGGAGTSYSGGGGAAGGANGGGGGRGGGGGGTTANAGHAGGYPGGGGGGGSSTFTGGAGALGCVTISY